VADVQQKVLMKLLGQATAPKAKQTAGEARRLTPGFTTTLPGTFSLGPGETQPVPGGATKPPPASPNSGATAGLSPNEVVAKMQEFFSGVGDLSRGVQTGLNKTREAIAPTLQRFAPNPTELPFTPTYPGGDPEGLIPLQRNQIQALIDKTYNRAPSTGGGGGGTPAPVGNEAPAADPGFHFPVVNPNPTGGQTPSLPSLPALPNLDLNVAPVDSQAIAREVQDLLALEYGQQEMQLRRSMDLLGLNSQADIDVLQNLMQTSPEIINAVFEGAQNRQQGNLDQYQGFVNDSRERIGSAASALMPFLQGAEDAEGRMQTLAHIGQSQVQAIGGLETQALIGAGNLLQQMNDTAAEGAFQVGAIQSQLAADIATTQARTAEQMFIHQTDLQQVIRERGIAGTQLARELTREAEDRNRQIALDRLNTELAKFESQMTLRQFELDQQTTLFNQDLARQNLDLDRQQMELLRDQFGLDRTIADRNFSIDQGRLDLNRQELAQRQAEQEAAQRQAEQEANPTSLLNQIKETLRSNYSDSFRANNAADTFGELLSVTALSAEAYFDILNRIRQGFVLGFNNQDDNGLTTSDWLKGLGFRVPVNPQGQTLGVQLITQGSDGRARPVTITPGDIQFLLDAGITYFNA